jgi:hypothetical protein
MTTSATEVTPTASESEARADTVSEGVSREAEPLKSTRDQADMDREDESETDIDTEIQDTVGSKRRGIRLKQDLN